MSESFEYTDAKMNTIDDESIAKLQWHHAVTEPDGLLNICKYAQKKIWGRARENSNDIVWLKYEWDEPIAGSKPLGFDYVNRCTMYLNGQKIFSGSNLFLLKGSLYRGDIDKKMRGNTVYLPVKKGKNILMISVSNIPMVGDLWDNLPM